MRISAAPLVESCRRTDLGELKKKPKLLELILLLLVWEKEVDESRKMRERESEGSVCGKFLSKVPGAASQSESFECAERAVRPQWGPKS